MKSKMKALENKFHLLMMIMVLALFMHVDMVLGNVEFQSAIKAAEAEEDKHSSNCASTRRVKRYDHARFPFSPPTGSKFGKALRFLGSNVVRFAGAIEIPSHQFTLDFWMKPEGGQKSPVTVIGLFDDCASESKDGGWEVGLDEASAERSLRVFFRLRSQRSQSDTKLRSPLSVEPNTWLHVAATYDGKRMILYINQAKVAVSTKQKGHIFAKGFDECEHLEAGGNLSSGTFFRGTLDEVRLWSVAKSHKEISTNVFAPVRDVEPFLEMYESFADNEELNRNPKTTWTIVTSAENPPEVIESTIPGDAHDLSIVKPPCGSTVCDNPEIIKSYVKNTHLRGKKIVRYRVVNILEDDGSNPMVTKKQIKFQHVQLNKAFAPYNISFQLKELEIRNTSLRRRTVTFKCESAKIGDLTCNQECKHNITGNDGGDCDETKIRCGPEKRGNGKCDPECNNFFNGWDSGECCNANITDVYKTCFDPTSPNRAYISDREYKSLLNLDNGNFLNVYLARWSDVNLLGVATFPWEKSAHSIYGGIILGLNNFGRKHHTSALVHEFGHVLGLWHVHHGVSELEDCADDCAETFPSLELGDLCSDTNPTPANDQCSDPVRKDSMTCGVKKFRNTPFRNYMSYANDSCTDSFTKQQAARMHCYVDLVYQSWQQEKTPPSFIPLPLRVTSKAKDKVSLAWIPPLGTGGANALNSCHECREDRVFQQYAETATSPIPSRPNGYWSAHQATGAPDAEPCNLTPKGWCPLDQCEECYITFGFKEAVIPTSLSVWVVWSSKEGITDITLIFVDGTEKSLGNATAQCDSPLTMPLKVNKRVSKIRIHVKDMTVIDAIQLTSSVNHPNCLKCEPLEYLVSRQPPFPSGQAQRVKTTRFEDRHLIPGKLYTYKVKAVTSFGLEGPPSPPLVYSPIKGFCGDGIVEESIGEECDDGNVRDADGCNVQCKKEDVFHCTGHPSLCYRHDGDGICEEFERKTSIKDCGFYTPEGFQDQWAVNVTVNPRDRHENCPEQVTLGLPSLDLVCQSSSTFKNGNYAYAWGPCESYVDGNHWLEATFNRSVVPASVVLYIGSDGKTGHNLEKTVKIELIDSSGRVHPSGHQETKLSCKTNPAVIPIHHDMTKPFFYVRKVRISFKSYLISIAGVALRSRTNFDVVELSKCGPEEIFSPRTQHCHNYLCERPSCHKLVLKHAKVNCEGTEEGQTCSVTCKPGYRPFKTFKMICLNKEWQGLSTACVPVNCSFPRIPNGKGDCPDGHTFGKKCSIKCDPQAKMSGGQGSVTCEADGKWSAQTAFCVMTCPNPIIPEHSELLAASNCITTKRTFLPGDSCKFRCKPGYRPKDRDEPTRRAMKMRCTKSGKWTHSTCEPVVCKEISASLLMWYNCSKGNALGSVCSSHCPGKEVHTVKCGDKGEWSAPMRRCKSRSAGICRVPVPPPGVIITCEDHFAGGICKVKCKNSFYDVIEEGDEEATHVNITCTKKLDWKPDPARLRCIPSCREEYISDEWCDRSNNNKHCRWDGGDCCASTTNNRIVRRIPTTCMLACDCKDPNAIENLPSRGGDDNENDDDDDDRTDGSGSEEESQKTSN